MFSVKLGGERQKFRHQIGTVTAFIPNVSPPISPHIPLTLYRHAFLFSAFHAFLFFSSSLPFLAKNYSPEYDISLSTLENIVPKT